MKAYVVSDREGYSEWEVVVFAESRGKAIVAALGTDEFSFEYWSYTELRAIRKPEFDKCYRGNLRMDWNDPNDRLAMVRDGGYYCNEDAFDPDDCAKCSGKDYCSRYEEYLDEEVEWAAASMGLTAKDYRQHRSHLRPAAERGVINHRWSRK